MTVFLFQGQYSFALSDNYVIFHTLEKSGWRFNYIESGYLWIVVALKMNQVCFQSDLVFLRVIWIISRGKVYIAKHVKYYDKNKS